MVCLGILSSGLSGSDCGSRLGTETPSGARLYRQGSKQGGKGESDDGEQDTYQHHIAMTKHVPLKPSVNTSFYLAPSPREDWAAGGGGAVGALKVEGGSQVAADCSPLLRGSPLGPHQVKNEVDVLPSVGSGHPDSDSDVRRILLG